MIFHCILIIYYCYCYHYNCIILYLYYIYISVYIYISIHIPLCPGKVFVYCNLDPDVGHQKFGYSLGEDHFNFALVQKLEPPGFLEKRRKFALKWGMESWSLTADVSLVCFCTIQDLSNWKYWIGLWFVDLQTELSDCQSPMRCRWPDERKNAYSRGQRFCASFSSWEGRQHLPKLLRMADLGSKNTVGVWVGLISVHTGSPCIMPDLTTSNINAILRVSLPGPHENRVCISVQVRQSPRISSKAGRSVHIVDMDSP